MKTLKELVSSYYQKKYKMSASEALEKANEGDVDVVEQDHIAHTLLNSRGESIRYIYIRNLDELVLIDTHVKNDEDEWVKLII